MKYKTLSVWTGAALLGMTWLPQSFATVLLEHTPILNQHETGFCWSYATTAYLEQNLRRLKQGWVVLSPEYIGFYHIAEQLMAGKGDRIHDGGETSIALDWIEKYGLVPEEFFKFKIFGQNATDSIKKTAREFRSQKGLGSDYRFTLEEALTVIERSLRIPHIPRAHEKFKFRGTEYTPKEFARQRIGFRRNDHYTLSIVDPRKDPVQYQKQLFLIKKALVYGYSAPVTVAFFPNSLNEELYARPHKKGEIGRWQCKECSTLTEKDSDGGHLILLTDFVTQDSALGWVDQSRVLKALKSKPQGWLFKNSWGIGRVNNASGRELEVRPVRGMPTWGFLTQDYFDASNRVSRGCENCPTLDFSHLVVNAAEDEPLVTYVNIPSRFVRPKKDPAGAPILSGIPQSYDLSIDVSEVEKTVNAGRAVHDRPRPTPPPVDQHKVYIEPAPAPVELYGARLQDALANDVVGRPGQGPLLVVFKFSAKSPNVKSIGLFINFAEKGKQLWNEEPDYVMMRSSGFEHVQAFPVGEKPSVGQYELKFQPFDANGSPVGQPMIRTITVRVVEDQ